MTIFTSHLKPGHAPVSLGDYLAGSNHVLPTGGTARHTSGLTVWPFGRLASASSAQRRRDQMSRIHTWMVSCATTCRTARPTSAAPSNDTNYFWPSGIDC